MGHVTNILTISMVILYMSSTDGKVPESSVVELLRQNLRLTPIGSINGKSFFMDAVTKTWTAALNYCLTLNMQLATITSLQENDFLKNNTFLTNGAYYWTAGRDVLTRAQYQWNLGGTLGTYGNLFSPGAARTCLSFRAGSAYGGWYGQDCATSRAVLCQN